MGAERSVIPVDGPLAPPRRNGELVFDEPWQSRVFGLAAVLQEQGRWTWDEFAARVDGAVPEDVAEYYEAWLDALESLLIGSGVVTADEIEVRAEQFADGVFDHHDP